MRSILSAAAGGLAVGLIALMTVGMAGRSAGSTGLASLDSAVLPASGMPVQCAAWQDAIVQRVGADAVRVTCVDRVDAHAGSGVVTLASVRQEPVARARPAVTERVVYRDPPRGAERTAAKSDRPASKSVLIIAGATGAGAGTGGLIGGRKGALAGAAIGGGAAAIYEAIKR
jgi:hypothetical protein